MKRKSEVLNQTLICNQERSYKKGLRERVFNVVFKICFQILLSLSLFSCGFGLVYQSSSLDEEELQFIKSASADQSEIFKKSEDLYAGSPECSLKQDCRQICDTLFSESSVQKQCSGLKSRQVYQMQSLYENILTEELVELKKIKPFDLKVFFTLNSKIFFDFLKSVKPNSIKAFLTWIVEDWKIGTVFQQEDDKFLYMQLFLNKLNVSPIRSLRENLKGDRTFVELAWVKQNDMALAWLNDYLEDIYCQSENKKECMLGAYCMLYKTWEHDILLEIQESEILSSFLDNPSDFQSVCSEVCSSQNCQEEV